jgi:preprotein translocase subunit YajC
MFIATAYAMGASGGDAAAQGQGGGGGFMVVMIVIFAIMYFLVIRPQQKQIKQHKKMVEELKKGDEVVVGGIYGTVENATPGSDALTVKIAEGVKVKVLRGSVAAVVTDKDKAKE